MHPTDPIVVSSDGRNILHENDDFFIGWNVEKKSSGLGFASTTRSGNIKGDALYTDGKGHSLTVAATGTGKTVMLISRLLCCPQSAIIVDVKGEIYNTTNRYRRDKMGHDIILFDPTRCIKGKVKRASFNPLDVFGVVGGDL